MTAKTSPQVLVAMLRARMLAKHGLLRRAVDVLMAVGAVFAAAARYVASLAAVPA